MNKETKIKKRKYIFLISFVLFLLGGIFAENFLTDKKQSLLVSRKFEKTLHNQEKLMTSKLEGIKQTITAVDFNNNFQDSFHQLSSLSEKKGIGFSIIRNNKLLYWSDNRFSFIQNPEILKGKRVMEMPNGIYLNSVKKVNDFYIVGSLLIKTKYKIQNQFLSDHFSGQFHVPNNYTISMKQSNMGFPVQDVNNKFLFSLIPEGQTFFPTYFLLLPALLYILAIIFLLTFIKKYIFYRISSKQFTWKIIGLGFFIFLLYFIHIFYHFPKICYDFNLFKPYLFASCFLLPSLGDFLIVSILLFFWGICFSGKSRYFDKKLPGKLIVHALFLILIYYFFAGYLIQNLIRNSTFYFHLNKINELSLANITGYLIIANLLFSAVIMHHRIVLDNILHIKKKNNLILNIILIIVFTFLSVIYRNTYVYIICLFLFVNFFIIILYEFYKTTHSLPYLSFFILLITLFSLFIIQNNKEAKRCHIQKLMAVTLYSENDPTTEFILSEMQTKLKKDSVIPGLLSPPYEELKKYLRYQYFNGYFNKYDIHFTVCQNTDSLLVLPEKEVVSCCPFFDNIISKNGMKILGTNFYYLNNMDGRISYFGKFFYPIFSESAGVFIYVEMQSRLLSKGIGFPELLIGKDMKRPKQYEQFSYAKFYNNKLVFLSGDEKINYSFRNDLNCKEDTSGFTFLKKDNYNHLIYRLNRNNTIIVSTPTHSFLNYLISFFYLFVFYFLFSLIVLYLFHFRPLEKTSSKDLRFKIQASIVSIVFVSMVIFAGTTIYYNIKSNCEDNQEDLNAKMGSISEEINIRLQNINGFTPDVCDWVENELNDLSNIFITDINIYGNDGTLRSSSRPEIVSDGLLSYYMNATAFYELKNNRMVSYMQPEKIGELNFLSVYKPIINKNGIYIGFLNLPYFSKGDQIKQQITNTIVATINLYMLLFFLSVIVAILLAKKITQPLTMIREKLKNMGLNKENELIIYKGENEIGALVKEYNHKVNELAESADLLARSERETAWREMAKQIAHEIKNPLTPMKLDIQYLQRAKKENNPHYDEFFNRVTVILIEQIDTLSKIATEFSTFAKTPTAKSKVFNIGELLEHICQLYETNPNSVVILESIEDEDLMIKADKEQITRAFINLITNALEAIPQNKKGLVLINLMKKDSDHVLISVSDNGTGIPENIRKKLFEPNFTTKSSGTGIGLAIVKNIVEAFYGKIRFETETGKKTTFFITFPLAKTEN